jgi:hypothetical protein
MIDFKRFLELAFDIKLTKDYNGENVIFAPYIPQIIRTEPLVSRISPIQAFTIIKKYSISE